MYVDSVIEIVKQYVSDSANVVEYINLSRSRIEFTVEQLRKYNIENKRVCEIGFGAIGLACHLELNARVDAYDIDDTYKSLCNDKGIQWNYLDLENRTGNPPNTHKYEVIILCEVIEHINRSPVSVLRDLRQWLVPGGHILVSTVNLVRLSNRLRLMAGRELFARYEFGSFRMGHKREYTISEIGYYLKSAGYIIQQEPFYFSLPDFRYSAPFTNGYMWLTKLFPNLSNLIYAFAKNPE